MAYLIYYTCSEDFDVPVAVSDNEVSAKLAVEEHNKIVLHNKHQLELFSAHCRAIETTPEYRAFQRLINIHNDKMLKLERQRRKGTLTKEEFREQRTVLMAEYNSFENPMNNPEHEFESEFLPYKINDAEDQILEYKAIQSI